MGRIKEVRFGLLSPEEVRARSVVHVVHDENLEAGKLRVGGLFDPHMGTLDKHLRCQTCGGTFIDCPGHFGHIELPKPMYLVGMLDEVARVLQCVCFHCSRLLVDKTCRRFRRVLKMPNPEQRVRALVELCRTRRACRGFPSSGDGTEDGCGRPQPVVRVADGIKLFSNADPDEDDPVAVPAGKPRFQVTGEAARAVLRRIADEDCFALGFDPERARPEWMILTAFPVLPPCARPSNRSNAAARAEDDLTHKLAEVVRASNNLRLKLREGVPASIVAEFANVLQYHVATFADNEIAGQLQALQRSGKPLKSVRQRIKGKDGRIRGNLMGKRTDYSARTVITPDPNIGLNEIGVPRSIARDLTFCEPVHPGNLERLRAAVRAGPTAEGGANFVWTEDRQQRIDLRHASARDGMVLRCGMRVDRHLQVHCARLPIRSYARRTATLPW